ncbi:MAG: TM2 domain-containing protein, partial [Bacteroidales bacterium]
VFTQPNSNRSNDNDSIIPKSNNPKDKSFLVTVLLWAFLGGLGIHRFYLGHIGIGVLYLLTGALCGIGWIIDIILLVTGGLQPKGGKYID